MEIGQTEIERYKNLLDWLQNGSGKTAPSSLCYSIVTNLPSTKRYFDILYKFLGDNPISDQYIVEHWGGIEKECRKSKDFDIFITWYITQTCSSAECDVKVTLYADDSIAVQYIGKEPPLPKYKVGDEVTARYRYVSGDYSYFTGIIKEVAWDAEALKYEYTIQGSCIERSCVEHQIMSAKRSY